MLGFIFHLSCQAAISRHGARSGRTVTLLWPQQGPSYHWRSFPRGLNDISVVMLWTGKTQLEVSGLNPFKISQALRKTVVGSLNCIGLSAICEVPAKKYLLKKKRHRSFLCHFGGWTKLLYVHTAKKLKWYKTDEFNYCYKKHNVHIFLFNV